VAGPPNRVGVRCRVHSVALQTANFDAAYDFYTRVVGLAVVREPYPFKTRTLAWLDGGGMLIEMYSVKDGVEPVQYSPKSVGPDHLAFVVDDLDSMIGWLTENNIRIVKGPMVPPSGDPRQPRVLFVEGPDGEEVQFREPTWDHPR
jgi:catechol 2,3-dioxygenase-like lactoylglutathione lyase family enzyme